MQRILDPMWCAFPLASVVVSCPPPTPGLPAAPAQAPPPPFFRFHSAACRRPIRKHLKGVFPVERQLTESINVLRDFCAKLIKERRGDADYKNREDLLSRFLLERDENGNPLVRRLRALLPLRCRVYFVEQLRSRIFLAAQQSDERLRDVILSFISKCTHGARALMRGLRCSHLV